MSLCIHTETHWLLAPVGNPGRAPLLLLPFKRFNWSFPPSAWQVLSRFVSTAWQPSVDFPPGCSPLTVYTTQSQHTMFATSPLTSAVVTTKGDKLVLHKAAVIGQPLETWSLPSATPGHSFSWSHVCFFSGLHFVGVHAESFGGLEALILCGASYLSEF